LGTVGLHRVDAGPDDIEKLFMSLIERLKNPEDHYEFTDPKKANAVLMSLCQEAADALAAQRPWVGLTDEEIQTAWDSVMDGAVFTRREVYKAIEAKLRSKNNG
jgi:DNA-binding MltR family transcriptional regulator